MTVEMNELDHVLKLSHLHIADDEKAGYLEKLQSTLETMKSLDSLDLSQVEPSSHSNLQTHFLREDIPENHPNLLLEKNAPDWEDGYFSVPQILGGE
jgi:aspartyl-tRNA(Asn)/glutamyl-tRNA(Gln) amidotransferase subunit C